MSRTLLFLVFLFLIVSGVCAIDFWQYPEAAEKHSLFAGSFIIAFNFKDLRFSPFFPEFYLDYLLPVGLPFSFGISVQALNPDMMSAGIRPAYHINLDNDNTDLYVLYALTLIADQTQETLVLEYGGRIGIRQRIGRFFCICIETSFKLRSIYFGLALKLN